MALPYLAFFLSGASSLIFQSLWTRMLHHTFGATSVAMSTVLTAFMSGLGLGAYVFGKRAARFARPLVVYALAEVGVALSALLIPPLVRSDGFFSLVNAFLRHNLGEGSFAFMAARFLCVMPILLVPTTLMGGTLPLLAQHFVPRGSDREAGAKVGALYALNTFGAVAGTALASFVLMPAIGVRATNYAAVGINLALATAILLAQRKRVAPVELPPVGERSRGGVLILIAFGVSGACSMAYEVVWSRALAMAIGSSLQSFALILVTFLIGIAGGSATLSHLLAPGPSRGLWLTASVSALLCLLALAPALVLSDATLTSIALAVLVLGLLAVPVATLQRARALRESGEEELDAEADRVLDSAAWRVLLVPVSVSLLECVRFASKRSSVADVALHGYLPYITAGTVLACALALGAQVVLRERRWLLAGAVQLGIALSTLCSYAFQDEIPYSFARLVSALDDLPNHVGTVRFFMLLAAGLCTLPATLGMGAMFPITLALWAEQKQGAGIGDEVGRVYGANTIGSIVGAWLPGFVLLPWIGMENTLAVGMGINTVVAIALLLRAQRASGRGTDRGRGTARGMIGVAGMLLVMLGAHRLIPGSPLSWNLSHMTLGAFRVSLAREVLNPASWGQPDLVYYRDGISTTVSVERWGRHLALKNNGKVDASNGDDMPTQIMVSAYPLLLHPRGPKDLEVAIVGFGSGVTVGAALEFPVRHIDNMELEDAVVDAGMRFFADVSHLERKQEHFPYVRHPRLTLFKDDGRNFLAAVDKKYDVIVSEPSNPWITGVSDLFTVDHFQVTKKKLEPGGVYCQWVQLYELSPENIKTVYRTFASQFAHVVAFAAEELSSDTILIGSDSPLPLDLAHIARSLEDPRVARELERAYVHSPADVWSRILFASRDELMRFTQTEWRQTPQGMAEQMRATGSEPCVAPGCKRAPVPLNTDDNMLIELRAPSDLIGFARYDGYLSTFYAEGWPYGDLSKHLKHVDTDADKRRMALSLLAHGRKRGAASFARDLPEPSELEARIDAQTIALLLRDGPDPVPELEPPIPSLPLEPELRGKFDRFYAEGARAFDSGDYRLAAAALERLPEPYRTLSGPGLRFRYALAVERSALEIARHKLAVGELEELIRRDETYTEAHPELFYFLSRALYNARNYDKAVRAMRRYAATLVAR
ncbi:MAG TPA: fused MFS/spermidine synthase [Polyangiales bacterium]|nr:fused MFS/spermidine synthase [Polyangiales bacterium]